MKQKTKKHQLTEDQKQRLIDAMFTASSFKKKLKESLNKKQAKSKQKS